MRSRLQSSIAELYKLKNQIRVQLNQIRPKTPPSYPEKAEKHNKRMFTHRFNQSTSIVNPPEEKSKPIKVHSKRQVGPPPLPDPQGSRTKEKKHYLRHYDATVELQNRVHRKTCAYFHVSPQRSPLASHNTSLAGIGLGERERERSSSRRRVSPLKYMCAGDII